MPRQVKTPDGIVHSFPEDATDAEISAALNAPPATARTTPEGQQRSWADTAVDALPMVGGAVGGLLGAATGIPTLGLTSAPGAIVGAGMLGAGGEAAKQLINRARGASAPATPMAAAGDIALQGGIQGGSELIGSAVAKGVSKGAQAVYRGYVKPSLAAKNIAKAQQIVRTALDEGLPISARGSAKADALIADLNAQVDTALRDVQGPIDLHAIAERVRSFAKRAYNRPGVPAEDYNAALRVADSIDAHSTLMKPGPDVTREVSSRILDESGQPFRVSETVPGPDVAQTTVSATEVNRLKQSLDRTIGETNFGVERGATKTTQKVGRFAARQAIERVAPEVAPLNAREAKLIDAARAIKHAVEREANQNKLYGVKTLASIGVGGGSYASGDDPMMSVAKGAATRALLSPGPQSMGAIVAWRLAKEIGVGAGTAARLAAYVLAESPQDETQKQGQ